MDVPLPSPSLDPGHESRATPDASRETHLADLRRAVRRGDLDAVRAILDVDPRLARAESARGGSLLLEAHEREHGEIAALFAAVRERSGGEDLDVHEAAALARPGALRRALTDDPLAAEAVGPAGFLPLHRAAFAGDADGALLLLEMGADANARSDNGARLAPLHSAVAGAARPGRRGDPTRVVELLLVGGADPGARMEGGWTAAEAAARGGLPELAVQLAPPPAG